MEAVCIGIFTLEYFVRILTVHADQKEARSIRSGFCATFRYMGRPLQIVDLLSVVPFYWELFPGSISWAKILKLARILRLVKLGSRSPMILMYWDVLVMSGQPLMVLMFFNLLIAVLFGSLIYFAEGLKFSVDPDWRDPAGLDNLSFPHGAYVRNPANWAHTQLELTPFRSIPYSLWWVCVTVTTVGYGDFAPTTWMGKIIGIGCFYTGIILLALPISILGSNFTICYEHAKRKKQQLELENGHMGYRRKEKKKFNPFKRCLRAKSEGSFQDRHPPDTRKTGGGFSSLPWFPSTQGCRRKLFVLLEDPNASKLGRVASFLMMTTILVSTLSFILETMPEYRVTPDTCIPNRLTVADCEPKPLEIFHHVETVCIGIFTLDYVLRLLLVHAAKPEEDQTGLAKTIRFTSGWSLTLAYARQFMNFIDFLAVLPFYIQLAGDVNTAGGFLRVLRLVRIFRVLKMPKLRTCLDLFVEVGLDALPALVILLAMSLLGCVFFASCIYFAESSVYSVEPFILETFELGMYVRPTFNGYGFEPSPFESIPYAFWWFFTTATTVGYGDEYPCTTGGRMIACCVFMAGVILLAMPITVVGGSFNKYYEDWAQLFAVEAPDSANNGRSACRDEVPTTPIEAAKPIEAWGEHHEKHIGPT